MSAGKAPKATPDPSAEPPAQDPAEEDLEFVVEYPAVGESVTYVTIDTASQEPFEEAALITSVHSDGTTVSLGVLALHSRALRPTMDVPMGPHADPDDTGHYWRYPEAKAPVAEEELEDAE